MINILTKAGLSALCEHCSITTLYAFDLDGTLAPIVGNPADAKIPQEICRMMDELSQYAQTGIITGRSKVDTLSRICFTPHFVIGNHGIEGLTQQTVNHQKAILITLQWEQQLTEILRDYHQNDIILEKKEYSLSLHFRHAQYPIKTHRVILDAITKLTPAPKIISGKFVENIIPPGFPNKGEALQQLLEITGCSTALYCGDDITDEDVFRLKDNRILSIYIGKKTTTAAEYYLKQQNCMAALLAVLLQHLAKLHKSGRIHTEDTARETATLF